MIRWSWGKNIYVNLSKLLNILQTMKTWWEFNSVNLVNRRTRQTLNHQLATFILFIIA